MTSKDDRIEVFSTMLGAFILGSSFATEIFVEGRFEVRLFLLGLSCFVLFFSVAHIAGVRPVLFNSRARVSSGLWFLFFVLGSAAAIDLFAFQYMGNKSTDDVRLEIIVFLASYGLATNLLFYINRSILLESISQKTVAKYLLAPINGLSFGVILTGFFIWLFGG